MKCTAFLTTRQDIINYRISLFFFSFYLIGAPLACAGLKSTVIVVAVSLRDASTPS